MPAKKSSPPVSPPVAATPPPAADGKSPSELIDERIGGLPAWQGELLSRLRAVIRAADPDVVEEWKWKVPVWSCEGILCTGEAYKKVVKLTFAHGAALADPSRLFNSSLDGKVRRAIDVAEGGRIDEAALAALVRGAIALNRSSAGGRRGAPA